MAMGWALPVTMTQTATVSLEQRITVRSSMIRSKEPTADDLVTHMVVRLMVTGAF